jgi:hypothetical protein
MSHKLNCWEFHNCGREKGGLMADTLGVCPVSQAMRFDGTNGGQSAGRTCWKIPNSVCQNNRLSSGKGGSCAECAFYRRVHFEEHGQPERISVIAQRREIVLTRT